ncbi:PQQ-dependent sugar dehydrogenase [Maricaulis sp.]|uniref:PQQ-dependent sugar dehydrogenase n=1 Tax=Maricaulis sp. TaxID=1486257 RepID=UPI002B269F0B|nr:PQQ-dependent sugar dehydrogenase [Maricaulis sp.]
MRIVASLAATAILTSGGFAQSDIHETEQADFRVETIAGGLAFPWSVAFLPDGDMLVSEREGRLRLIEDGILRAAPVAGLPDILVEGQGGLMGLAVHPDFADNRLVYFAYAEGRSGANHTALGRGRLNSDATALEAVETLFQVNFEKERGYHFGGRLQFLADSTLLLTLGDGNRYRNEAQNLNNHLGTIVRLNDDGTVPFDNPFVSARGARPEILSFGHRNVQGIAINPQTGSVWAHEHGARGGDEINLIEPGSNYGWPLATYGVNYNGTPISDDTHGEGLEQPIWFWDPSIAPSGLTFYDGEGFENWRGDAFVGALAGSMLVRFEVEGDRVISSEELLVDRGERIRDVAAGPDGNLYVLTDYREGQVLRLVPIIP